ncbi:uncharacterized protein TNCV_3579911 [Trichonephila clavipes]|nr:uncharacterized protein TNCV_3579911 [Trichonephila clavipes]
MSSCRETTESGRLLVVKWSKEGKSLREITSLVGVTHGCVQKILQKYKKTGSVANIPRRGSKEILCTTTKRKIIHSVKKVQREAITHSSPSLDLNVIENLWSQLEKHVHEHEITSKEVLKKVLREEWAKLSVETTKTLVESMPRRLQAVIQAKGYATKY